MPERGPVGDGVVDRAPYKDSVGELRDLDGHQRLEVAGVADSPVEGEELLEAIRNVVVRRENAVDGEVLGFGEDEINAGVVADDVDMAVVVGDETASERREVNESDGERLLNRIDEVVNGIGRGIEENALLDVLTGQHRKIRNREFQRFDCGSLLGNNCAFGNQNYR